MPVEWHRTGNSGTRIAYDTRWRVLDVGSGHNPHPRANVLIDKCTVGSADRLGRAAVVPSGRTFIVADACAMPFGDGAFDFVICSHVAEHIENPDVLCSELNRVSAAGYLETPSRFTEKARPQPVHRWFVSVADGILVFDEKPECGFTRWYQRLFFSLYFYNVPHQLRGRRVFAFSHGCQKPCHYFLASVQRLLQRLWVLFRGLTYTRLLYHHGLNWVVKHDQGDVEEYTGCYLDQG